MMTLDSARWIYLRTGNDMEYKSERAKKLAEAGVKRHGSIEAWRAFLADSAKKAKHTKPQGMAWLKIHDPDRLKEISSKGGKVSVRPKKG